jgi:outer membrane receptor protein involved in Fe transport
MILLSTNKPLMKNLLLTLVLFSIVFTTLAQMPGGTNTGANRARTGGANMNVGHFYGKLVDAKTNRGLEAASVQLIQSKMDAATNKRKDTIISGMLTRANGEFSLENLPVMGSYRLNITAIGYKPVDQKISFELKIGQGGGLEQMLNAVDKDLGNIKMEPDAQVLDNVVVNASKSLMQMGIDRKVFNVDKNIASAGGTAIDVMRNVPSLQVDIDGNVSLRNAAPQLFVDGRPTNLTLEQIPADAIQSVEIITNPSAKFDASGGTAGILNVVLKKTKRTGYSGSIRANVDSRGRVGGGGDINIRQGKINLFANANYSQRKSISTGTTNRRTFIKKDSTTNLFQKDKATGVGNFAFGRLGFDYFIDNRNTITVAGNAVRGSFKNTSNNDITVDSLLSSGKTTSFTNRVANLNTEFKNYGSSLSFKHNFAKAGKELTADVNFNKSNNSSNTLTTSNIYKIAGGTQTGIFKQLVNGSGSNKNITAQTDYVNPLSEKSKIEMGARVNIRNIDSKNDIFFVGNNGALIKQPLLSSNYTNEDKVYAGYATYSNMLTKKLSYQVGLRIESSEYKGTVFTTSAATKNDTTVYFSNSFPASLFPSLFINYKINDQSDFQVNYTRRINRPNFFQLFPFVDYTDSLNLSRGNPDLKPEFTNSLEASYQKTYKNNNSILISAYMKYTTGLITRNQTNGINPSTGKDVLINSYINADNSYIGGMEFTAKNNLAKWWELNTNLNLFTSKININDPKTPEQDAIYSYLVKINNSFKLPKNFSVQLSGDYTSKTILPAGGSSGGGRFGGGGGGFFGGPQTTSQGFIRPNYGVDVAVRFEFLKNRTASLSLNMNDVLRTRRSNIFSEAISFTQNSFRRRDPQVLRLNFSWRFGKFDTQLFKRKNMKGERENMQGIGDGIQQ